MRENINVWQETVLVILVLNLLTSKFFVSTNNRFCRISICSIDIFSNFPDGPSIDHLEPRGVIKTSVGSSKVLRCRAGGSPGPSYQWLHKLEVGGEVEVVGDKQDLEIVSVGYQDSGEYICR